MKYAHFAQSIRTFVNILYKMRLFEAHEKCTYSHFDISPSFHSKMFMDSNRILLSALAYLNIASCNDYMIIDLSEDYGQRWHFDELFKFGQKP